MLQPHNTTPTKRLHIFVSYAAPGTMATGFNYYRVFFQLANPTEERILVVAVGGDKSYGRAIPVYQYFCRYIIHKGPELIESIFDIH